MLVGLVLNVEYSCSKVATCEILEWQKLRFCRKELRVVIPIPRVEGSPILGLTWLVLWPRFSHHDSANGFAFCFANKLSRNRFSECDFVVQYRLVYVQNSGNSLHSLQRMSCVYLSLDQKKPYVTFLR